MPVCLVTHVNPNNYLDFLLIKCRAIALFISVSDVRQGLKFKSGSRSICFHQPIPYLLIPLTTEASSSSVNFKRFLGAFLGGLQNSLPDIALISGKCQQYPQHFVSHCVMQRSHPIQNHP